MHVNDNENDIWESNTQQQQQQRCRYIPQTAAGKNLINEIKRANCKRDCGCAMYVVVCVCVSSWVCV